MKKKEVVFVEFSKSIDSPVTGYAKALPAVAWVAAGVHSDKWQVKILNAADFLNLDDLTKAILFQRPDVVAISAFTCGWPDVYLVAKKLLDIQLIFGGWHPSLVPQEILFEFPESIVVVARGENIIQAILDDLQEFRGKIVKSFDHPPIPRPLPLRQSYNEGAVFQMLGTPIGPHGSFSSGGGCPKQKGCDYCCTRAINDYGGRGYFTPINLLKKEMEQFIKTGIKFVLNRDENPMRFAEHLKKFCQMMIDNGFSEKIKFGIFGDITCANRDLLRLLSRAGCSIIFYGIDFIKPAQLKEYGRDINSLDLAQKVFEQTRNEKIFVNCSFIHTAHNSRDDFTAMTNWAKESLPDEFLVLHEYPPPGTPEFQKMQRFLRQPFDLRNFTGEYPVLELQEGDLGVKKLQWLRIDASKKYYSSDRYKELLKFRHEQFGDSKFKLLTSLRRERWLAHDLDIWKGL